MQSRSLLRSASRQGEHDLIRRARKLTVRDERAAVRQEDAKQRRIVRGVRATGGERTHYQHGHTSDGHEHLRAIQHFTRVDRAAAAADVEKLWTDGANPVENLTRKKILGPGSSTNLA